ncbi:DUF6119 family protein [Carnobacterium maltaromaticum]|uniref:DUF6119 family protein n=1 Tax=Carnobacterium maltaromaticum TaxID=2751 RepID=UPI001E43C3E7|nr:DUF6119 family protein [Carnobacterium maltaromaticum]
MKLILSKCKSNTLNDILEVLRENNYVKIGTNKIEPEFNLEMFLFFESHEKDYVSWLSEILSFFNVSEAEQNNQNLNQDVLHQYNAIIIFKTKSNLFAHSFGQGFRVMEQIIDSEFGLKFAEKTIKSEQITLKNVSYIQKNKMKGITNYKKDQGEFPKASESYAFVSGRPDFELFGSNIDCGTGVSFPIDYKINTEKGFKQLAELINNVDIALELKENKSILPRVKKVKKKSTLTNILDNEILSRITENKGNMNVALDVSKIHLADNSIDIYSGNNHLIIYVVNKISETAEEIAPDDDSIIKYVNKYKDLILSLDNVKIKVTNYSNNSIVTKPLREWIYCELEYEEKVYILDSGFWGYFNDRFSELLKTQLDDINRIVSYENLFNIPYVSGKGHLAGEGGYIEEITKSDNLIKLHQRNVSVNKVKIEVADIYKKDTKELIAIKRGMDTSNCMYSFEQSVLSVQILRNSEEFSVKKNLLKYNKRKNYPDKEKYPNIRENMIDKILDSRDSSVLWLHNTKNILR